MQTQKTDGKTSPMGKGFGKVTFAIGGIEMDRETFMEEAQKALDLIGWTGERKEVEDDN